MNTTIMAITVESRNRFAPEMQEVLTKHGCIIKMRLGLHEASKDACSPKGLILLQLIGEDSEVTALKDDLLEVEGINVNTMVI